MLVVVNTRQVRFYMNESETRLQFDENISILMIMTMLIMIMMAMMMTTMIMMIMTTMTTMMMIMTIMTTMMMNSTLTRLR